MCEWIEILRTQYPLRRNDHERKKGTMNVKGRMTGTRLCEKAGFVILSSLSQEDWSCCLSALWFFPRLEDFFPGSAGTYGVSFS